MDIGELKGKKGFGKGGGFGHFKGKKGKGKGKKGKLGKGKGKSAHMNFHSQAMAKGKGKDKGKSKLRGQHVLVCWTCGKSGHVASQCPSGRVSALDENAQLEVEELGDQGWLEDDWSADTWSEDWWSDDLVAAVFGDGTWDDDWWWSTWDDGWSDGWTDTSWSVVPPPAVEKATSSAAPPASEPKATSGAAVSAVTLEPPLQRQRLRPLQRLHRRPLASPLRHLHLVACLLALLPAWCLRLVWMCHLTACLMGVLRSMTSLLLARLRTTSSSCD